MQVVILCNAQLPPNFLMFHSHVDCPLIGLQAHSIESKHTIKVKIYSEWWRRIVPVHTF